MNNNKILAENLLLEHYRVIKHGSRSEQELAYKKTDMILNMVFELTSKGMGDAAYLTELLYNTCLFLLCDQRHLYKAAMRRYVDILIQSEEISSCPEDLKEQWFYSHN